MEDQFELGDLRQYMNGRPHFPGVPPPGDLFSGHRNLTQAQHYEMVMVGTRQMSEIVPHGLQDQFRSDCTTPSVTCTSTAGSLNGLETEVAGGLGGGDGGTGRWPRQETLTLLEIRSRLDSKFKEANQKGPLWDEVSRILSEEHGYQRSGKKCREKFENLYKYYKKTKEGKAGRQDGKNYRFFKQLEALYGETSNTVPISETHLVGNSFRFHNSINNSTCQPNQETFQAPKLSESLSLTSSSEFNSSSSDDNDVNDSTDKMKKRRGRRSWKGKIRDFIESQMRKLMEKQEAWLEKMMKTLERKEQERMIREEEWRKQEKARVDGEHKFWANERAWIEARDSALMKALQKFTEKEGLKASNVIENGNETINTTLERNSWVECEITRLIQLRTSMESRFEQAGGCSEEALWEEIAAKMACLGYERTGSICKEKWDSINIFLRQTNKKRKENSRSCYFENNDLLYNQQGGTYGEINEQGSTETTTRSIATNGGHDLPTNSNGGNVMNDSCFRLYMGDGENLWENYGMKLSKGEDNN